MRRRALSRLRDGLISLAYPTDCRVCGGSINSWNDGVACRACWEDPEVTPLFHPHQICRICGAPTDHNLCGDCSSLPFSAARSCGAYAGALEASILFLKSEPHLCPRLREIIERTYLSHREQLGGDLLVPIPLHPARLRERGFNQAALIAKAVSSRARLPVEDGAIRRTRDTERHRAGLDLLDREKSLSGAFHIPAPRLVEGLEVLIVDDLYTTGSTVASAARALIEAGAARVAVFPLGRVALGRRK